jgi:PhzF family phenazine biosynthesis protein
MKLPLFQVDAFAEGVFSGNPAAVCPLDTWLPDNVMQAIAAENNLSETAFFVREDPGFRLRWFTPTREVELCGHATLASAFVLWTHLGESGPLRFRTRSGVLIVEQDGDRIVLDFPALSLEPAQRPPDALFIGLGVKPDAVLANGESLGSGFYVALYPSEAVVRDLSPDFAALSSFGDMGVVATAPGVEAAFASRCFAPAFGIPEDPVTGSIHCFLVPYWAGRLGRKALRARQVSARGGTLYCEWIGDRVRIGGTAAGYLVGTIEVPNDERRP